MQIIEDYEKLPWEYYYTRWVLQRIKTRVFVCVTESIDCRMCPREKVTSSCTVNAPKPWIIFYCILIAKSPWKHSKQTWIAASHLLVTSTTAGALKQSFTRPPMTWLYAIMALKRFLCVQRSKNGWEEHRSWGSIKNIKDAKGYG